MSGTATLRVLQAEVMGTFQVTVDGTPIRPSCWMHGSAERLAKLLLITPGHRLRREWASDQMWPGTSPLRAAVNLRRALHFMRRALDRDLIHAPSIVDADHRGIWIAPHVEAVVDLDRLMAAMRRLSTSLARDEVLPTDVDEDLELIVRLGARDLLPDDVAEEWTVLLREGLLMRWERAAVVLADRALAEGHAARAHEIGEQILERDPASEEAHRLLIRSLVLEGLPHAARRQLELCRRALRDAFDIEPGPDTVAALSGVPRSVGGLEIGRATTHA